MERISALPNPNAGRGNPSNGNDNEDRSANGRGLKGLYTNNDNNNGNCLRSPKNENNKNKYRIIKHRLKFWRFHRGSTETIDSAILLVKRNSNLIEHFTENRNGNGNEKENERKEKKMKNEKGLPSSTYDDIDGQGNRSGEARAQEIGRVRVRGGGEGNEDEEEEEEGKVNMHKHRMDLRVDRAEGVCTLKIATSLVCMVAGTGTLSMPYAVAQSGWLGVVIVMLALFMSTTTGNMLIQCLYLNTDRRRSSFQQIARDAYGSMGHYIAVGAVGINLFGCAILYIILASTLIHGMVANPNDPSVPPSTFFIGCSLFVWVCLIFTKSMKEIAVLSLIGAGATVGVVMITVGVSAEMVIHRAVEAVAATHQFADWSKVPLSLATMSYAYGGNVVYPQVEQTMKHPRKWSTALWLALSTCFVMYISIAVAGYLAFGNLTMNPILENLPHGVWSTLANSLITLHVLLAAPILLASFAVMIEDSIAARAPAFEQGTKSQQFLKRATSRTIVILFAGLVASALPYFGDLMDLLGALATCLLVYVMPVLFYYRLGGMKNVFWLNQMWIWFIFVVGMVVIVVGTYDATKHLIEDIQHH